MRWVARGHAANRRTDLKQRKASQKTGVQATQESSGQAQPPPRAKGNLRSGRIRDWPTATGSTGESRSPYLSSPLPFPHILNSSPGGL